MLVIDDNMFRLAKMHETLLKMDSSNRSENLKKYKEIVVELDSKIFANFLENIKHIEEHSHTLETELKVLEEIVNAYNQLNELQLSFKSVCNLYGEDDLELSDLSQINIDYINNRVNTINGYLININNIEKNKIKIQNLNERLIDEEKKKEFIDNKLLELELLLKKNFIDAEGRLVVSGELQYTSILSEYSGLGFDVNELLNDSELLKSTLSEYNQKRYEVSESVRAAEVCYNSLLTADSRNVLDEIKKEYLLVKYKLTLLKMLEILSKSVIEYEEFVNKREQLIDLIKYRVSCMEELGIRFSIDPFSRIKIDKQLEEILSFSDNSKIISRLMKEISELNTRIEEMVGKNNEYLTSLNVTMPLLENRLSFDSGFDISSQFEFEDILKVKTYAENEVVDVKDVPSKFKMFVVKQKTEGVIKRVIQMIQPQPTTIQYEDSKIVNVSVPELVIIPQTIEKEEKVIVNELDEYAVDEDTVFDDEEMEDVVPLFDESFEDSLVPETQDVLDINNVDVSMFETVVPFSEPTLFSDRLEDDINEEPVTELSIEELFKSSNKKEDDVKLVFNSEKIGADASLGIHDSIDNEQMPDAFWIVQEEPHDETNEVIPSFDEQINKLLAVDNDDAKIRKKVA